MADNRNKIHKNLFYFGISCSQYDKTDIEFDIFTNIRKRFLISRKPASNKLYRSAGGVNCVYSYNFNLSKPIVWKVSMNKALVEDIEHLSAGKYCINYRDIKGSDLKRVHFDSHHNWIKTNYYNSMLGGDLICSFVPKETDAGSAILKYTTGENYPEILYACTIPSCDEVKIRILEKIPTPPITASTNKGMVYFLSLPDKENYEYILAEEEAKYEKDNAPVTFVSDKDKEEGFNLSVKDFDMSKNLNRTFDISLASEFSSKDFNTHSSDIIHKNDLASVDDEACNIDDSVAKSADKPLSDCESVDEAIAQVVNQINESTALEIDAEEIIVVKNIESVSDEDTFDDVIESEDSITIVTDDPEISKQLMHIDSVIDGKTNSENTGGFYIGESVVDDDYISAIIDDIIASAFGDENESADSDDVFEELESIAENSAVDELSDDNTTIPPAVMSDATVNDNEVCEEIVIESELVSDSQLVAEADKVVEVASKPEYESDEFDDMNADVAGKLSESAENTAPDAVISSRGERYLYFGDTDESGNRCGRGRTLTAEGVIAYDGEYADDKRNGFGSFFYKDSSLCYVGNWLQNNRNGFGMGISSDDKSIHAGNWKDNKPHGVGVRFDSSGNVMFISNTCEDKKKGYTLSDLNEESFIIRVWDESVSAFIQQEIKIKDIVK